MEKSNEKFAQLWHYYEKHLPNLESALREHLPLAPPKIETQFNEAIEYALFSGGKRLRPVLTLLGAELVGGNPALMAPSAVAVEFIHTSSLIFDDLPCMDNALERRGKTALHAKFGEGLAILVGLGFLNAAYPLVFVNHSGQPERAMQAHAEIVECVGASGMVGGQSVDLALAKSAGGDDPTDDNFDFESIRNLKTSALMRLALRVGAILAGASYIELAQLSRFAELLGDAYQLSDDLIDLEEDDGIFEQNKTFAINRGVGSAQLQLNNLVEEAKRILIENFPSNEARSCLVQLTEYLAERKT
ncbi:MAG: polyprenyl synthetase family protein [Pyrinomonadaceae bacterium]